MGLLRVKTGSEIVTTFRGATPGTVAANPADAGDDAGDDDGDLE